MKRLARFFARLYPSWWRARYGDEFDALLHDAAPSSRIALDVLSEALKMHLSTWSMKRSASIGLLSGLVIAAAIAFLIPSVYNSKAVLIGPKDQAGWDAFARRTLAASSRAALTSIIHERHLYASELARQPMDDVVELMRRNLKIENFPSKGSVEIEFAYTDPQVTQQVLFDIAIALSDGRDVQFVDVPSFSNSPISPPRGEIVGGGVAFGLLAGIASAIYFRRRNSHPCPTCGQPVATPIPPQIVEAQS